ncbi:MAG: TPM domain-containing protein [Cyanobacteria bacterium]|nr:TPM domain-containing protein [Cyanobacteriota bacterium]MDW8201331.1 TPM domain-containing protein [Cyanobacteriota bacterium SKYGB_h_bin112]
MFSLIRVRNYGLPLRHQWLRPWLLTIITALVVIILSLQATSLAQGKYPPFLDPHVNDYGKILKPQDAAAIRTTLQKFRADTGVHAVVLTVNSFKHYRTGDPTIESFATNIFNTWQIGDRTRNDGVLLLVAPSDRKVRIELGRGYGRAYDAVMQSVIQYDILPSFKTGDYSRGTYQGVVAIVRQLAPADTTAVTPSQFDGSETSRVTSFNPAWIIGGAGVTLLTSVAGATLYWRYRGRRCPRCQTAMTRLSEQLEDEYLNAGQRREESLQSVDYDVWVCPSCGYNQVKRYGGTDSSAWKQCPSCNFKTLKVSQTTLHYATYDYEGEEEIRQHCHYCGYSNTYTQSTPRLVRSDNSNYSSSYDSSYSSSYDSSSYDSYSSSSDRDGGSSSGGGATGEW